MKWINNILDLLRQILLRLRNIDFSTLKQGQKDFSINNPQFDVNVTIDDVVQSHDNSKDSALRWVLQNSINSNPFLSSDSDDELLSKFCDYFGDITYIPYGSSGYAFRSRINMPYFLIQDVLRILDPSNFIFSGFTVLESFEEGHKVYDFVLSNRGIVRGFSMDDVNFIYALIRDWGRPYLDSQNHNALGPVSDLARTYKDYQAREHNFQFARMHSREYLKLVIFTHLERLSTFNQQELEMFVFPWRDRVRNRFYEINNNVADCLAFRNFLENWWTPSNLTSLISKFIWDSPAINLDETPQKAFFDWFAFYIIDLYYHVNSHKMK